MSLSVTNTEAACSKWLLAPKPISPGGGLLGPHHTPALGTSGPSAERERCKLAFFVSRCARVVPGPPPVMCRPPRCISHLVVATAPPEECLCVLLFVWTSNGSGVDSGVSYRFISPPGCLLLRCGLHRSVSCLKREACTSPDDVEKLGALNPCSVPALVTS